MRAGRVVFFSLSCKHFLFFVFLFFFALKKSFCIPCWEKFEKLPKTFSNENDERSYAITKTTHLLFFLQIL